MVEDPAERDGVGDVGNDPGRATAAFADERIRLKTYRPNIVCEPTLPKGQRSPTRYFKADGVQIPSDASQLFGNAKRKAARRRDLPARHGA